ncbi:hypothetical protein GGR51DRAFT_555850 [Nemania sp. FL0031]|nr:hypothetical protein GGR51DRAFT_555850 [Nemania sp. FL0031]
MVQQPVGQGGPQYSSSGPAAWQLGPEPAEMKRPPMSLKESLTTLCHLPGDHFFVASEESGHINCLSTPVGQVPLNYELFFDQVAFVKEVKRAMRASGRPLDQPFSSEVDEVSLRNKRRYYQTTMIGSYEDEEAYRPKKRLRTSSSVHQTTGGQCTLSARSQIPIRPAEMNECLVCFDLKFKSFQQTVCKVLAKAWVKAVAPKKQSTNPYTRGDASRPDWWPAQHYKVGEEHNPKKMRHKEPDHIGREERVFLLRHILRLVMEEDEAMTRVGLDLAALETLTKTVLDPYIRTPNKPENKISMGDITDIFKVAKSHVSFVRGETDAAVVVYINEISEEDENEYVDDLDQKFTPIASGTSSVEPGGSQMITEIHANEHCDAGHFQSDNYPPPVALRPAQYPNSIYDSYSRPTYMEGTSLVTSTSNYNNSHLGPHHGTYPSPDGTSRRSSVFTPNASEYESPPVPAIYPSWQGSNTPSNPPMYSLQPVSGQVAQNPQYPTPSIDGLPRQAADTHHPGLYNIPRAVDQGAIQHQSAYPSYAAEGTPLGGPLNVKTEGTHDHLAGH